MNDTAEKSLRRSDHLRALVLISATALLAGCGDGGPGGGGGGTDTDGGGDEPTPAVLCEDWITAADEAPPTPVCGGGLLGAPPVLDPETQDFFDENNVVLPDRVIETDATKVGMWSEEIESHGQLTIHAIHRPTGKYLHFGGHDHGGANHEHDKVLWHPPAPCSPWELGGDITLCEEEFDLEPLDPDIGAYWEVETPVAADLFCSAHVNLPPRDTQPSESFRPRTLTVGGESDANVGVNRAWSFSEDAPSTLPIATPGDWEWSEFPVSVHT